MYLVILVISPPRSHFGMANRTPSQGNDLTGGAALPMFPAAEEPQDALRTDKKAVKSSGYHEFGHCGIACQGEDDQ
jgi:hypothetical protein